MSKRTKNLVRNSKGLWLWLRGFEKGNFFSEEKSERVEGRARIS